MTAPPRQSDVITAAKKQSTLGSPAYAVKAIDNRWDVASAMPETFRVCIKFTNGLPSTPEISDEEIGMRA